MGDVITYLEDGTSGIVTGGVDGSALVVGVCSKGTVGKGYLTFYIHGLRVDAECPIGIDQIPESLKLLFGCLSGFKREFELLYLFFFFLGEAIALIDQVVERIEGCLDREW